jgi:hypothetical protein
MRRSSAFRDRGALARPAAFGVGKSAEPDSRPIDRFRRDASKAGSCSRGEPDSEANTGASPMGNACANRLIRGAVREIRAKSAIAGPTPAISGWTPLIRI